MRELLPLLCLLLAMPAWAAPRRFALLVGSNDGGPRRALLRYAQTDVESMARVLGELGGVDPADLFLLRDPSAESLDQAWEQLDQRVRAAGPDGAEVLFYYSGHSDHQGLLLGGETYAYDGLRSTLEGLPARVRVGILDSCSSGAMVRGKVRFISSCQGIQALRRRRFGGSPSSEDGGRGGTTMDRQRWFPASTPW